MKQSCFNKFYLLLIAFAIFAFVNPAYSASSVSISGRIFKIEMGYGFLDAQTGNQFKLVAGTDSAKRSLEKLNDGDVIKGSAQLIQDTYVVQSVDFVGLQRILGLWKTKSTVINFVDFSQVQFHVPGSLSSYHYAISPTNSLDQWQVYFSDSSSVVLGSLSVNDQSAVIQLFDTETGNVTSSYELKKIQSNLRFKNENHNKSR